MSTTAQQLASVQAAIAALETGGQSVRMGDRQLTMADYAVLCDREKTLRARLASETSASAGRGRNRISYVQPD